MPVGAPVGGFGLGNFNNLNTGYSYWIYNSTPQPGRLQINVQSSPNGPGQDSALNNVRELRLSATFSYTYSINKNYQLKTDTIGFRTSASFSITPGAWDDILELLPGTTASANIGSSTTQSFYHYSSPETMISSNLRVRFLANGTFSNVAPLNPGITNFEQVQLDFSILGYSYYKRGDSILQPSVKNSLGWVYEKDNDIYFWYDYVSGSPSSIAEAKSRGYFPVGGENTNKKSDIGYRLNNALYKFIPYTNFNLSFLYKNVSNKPLNIYLSSQAPSFIPADWSQIQTNTYTIPTGSILLATITQSVVNGFSSLEYEIPINFFGVNGNKYLIFVGGFAGASSSSPTYSAIYIKNLKVDGGYHPGNNRQYLMSNFASYSVITQGLTGATYSFLIGFGNTINATSSLINPGLNQIFSKIGNGLFNAGIWENGVWNSGWRVDKNMYEFYNVSRYFNYNRTKRWRVQIIGPEKSIEKFNISDNVAISNIVAIDINEKRHIIKGYFSIINKTKDSIIVEFDSNFPLRRIEKDSEYHRIYVTKNVWLSGGFLNGYFTGIWNYGLFKGYPLITEMYDSHWLDGFFDGGHFYSKRYTIPNFVNTLFDSGFVGLTFSSPHSLAVGDIITIDKTDKSINPQYDGEHIITKVVNDYHVVTDISFGIDSLQDEDGSVSVELSSGLLQRVDFKSNNISNVTSISGAESSSIFIYNSWLDVVFDSSYATNIGKPQSYLNKLSKKSYSENNLYGYITRDVLESNSRFRDSFSNTERSYKLGTKYKIFSDFIGDSGNFLEDFGNAFADGSIDKTIFLKYGWTYSSQTPTSITFSRIQPASNSSLKEYLKVEAFRSGGILDITPTSGVDIPNRTYGEIERLRYTKIEYDLITYSTNINETDNSISGFQPSVNWHVPYQFKYLGTTLFNNYYAPPIHFDNLNLVKKDIVLTGGITTSIIYPAYYLPVNENVNPLLTKKQKKVEYFYNKRNLGMHFYGYSPYSGTTKTVEYVLDNLHFYEIDMIPFFSYFTEDNINKGVAIPYQGLSPFIDYNNSNFIFINNIKIGLDSIFTQNSNTPISGVGVGVTIPNPSNTISIFDVPTQTSNISNKGIYKV